jgi:cAMP phosphodiesterase
LKYITHPILRKLKGLIMSNPNTYEDHEETCETAETILTS